MTFDYRHHDYDYTEHYSEKSMLEEVLDSNGGKNTIGKAIISSQSSITAHTKHHWLKENSSVFQDEYTEASASVSTPLNSKLNHFIRHEDHVHKFNSSYIAMPKFNS